MNHSKKTKERMEELRSAIYDNGVRKTIKEWTAIMYPRSNSNASIHRLARFMAQAGHPIVIEDIGGCLVPLTQDRDTMRYTNGRWRKMIFGKTQRVQEFFLKELMEDPKMLQEIAEETNQYVQSYTSLRKLVLGGQSEAVPRISRR